MSVILFIFILLVLIVAHEWGHFFVAKLFKIRVDEFGIGFPPLAKKMFHKNGTDYTLNWIPFGGFVKIYGENYDSAKDALGKVPADSFIAKPKICSGTRPRCWYRHELSRRVATHLSDPARWGDCIDNWCQRKVY
jgi:membrane-associated protease RseP (regulator of RpoE activity)